MDAKTKISSSGNESRLLQPRRLYSLVSLFVLGVLGILGDLAVSDLAVMTFERTLEMIV